MGVEPGIFSPQLRDLGLRARLLDRCDLPESATLAIGVGRFSPEKRWPLVIAGATAASYSRPLGMLLVGDGHSRAAVQRAVGENPHVQLVANINDRGEMARLMASADLMIHGSSAETFGMAQAEARASALPMVVPDEGGASDQAEPGAALRYASGDAASAAAMVGEAIDNLPAMRAAALRMAPDVRTMDAHFDDLFARYTQIAGTARRAA
jgi:alpha-1,6-mannosyltransferase